MIVLCVQFHQWPKRQRVTVGAFERKRFLDREGEVRVLLHQVLEELFVDGHDGGLTADLDLAVHHAEIFAEEDLLRFIWKPLIVLRALLGVGDVLVKRTPGFLIGQIRQAVIVLQSQAFLVGAVCQSVFES